MADKWFILIRFWKYVRKCNVCFKDTLHVENREEYLLNISCLPKISLGDCPANITLITRTCLHKAGLISLKTIFLNFKNQDG